MRRRTFLFGPAWLLSSFSASCGRADGKVFALVPGSASSLYWQSVFAGAQRSARDFSAQALWSGGVGEGDAKSQGRIVRSLIEQGVEGIVLGPKEAASTAEAVRAAAAQGIPVALVDSPIPNEDCCTSVTTDHFGAGRMAAKSLAGELPSGAKALIVKEAAASVDAVQRELGFERTLADQFPQLAVVTRRHEMLSGLQALTAAEEALTQEPDIAALFCSTEAATMGAMRALRSRGGAGRVKLAGFGLSFALLHGLQGGAIHCLIAPDGFHVGYAAAKSVVQRWNEMAAPQEILCPARLVTADNLNDVAIERLFYP